MWHLRILSRGGQRIHACPTYTYPPSTIYTFTHAQNAHWRKYYAIDRPTDRVTMRHLPMAVYAASPYAFTAPVIRMTSEHEYKTPRIVAAASKFYGQNETLPESFARSSLSPLHRSPFRYELLIACKNKLYSVTIIFPPFHGALASRFRYSRSRNRYPILRSETFRNAAWH